MESAATLIRSYWQLISPSIWCAKVCRSVMRTRSLGKLAASGKPLSSLSADDFRAASGAFGRDVHGVFDVRAALRRRPATGAPSPENIERQMARWRRLLAFE